MRFSLLALLLTLISFSSLFCFAEQGSPLENDDEISEEENGGAFNDPENGIPVKMEEIETYSYFPENPFGNLVTGKPSTLLIGVRNKSKQNITVFRLRGSLRNPSNFTNIYRNLTEMRAQLIVPGGFEGTLVYSFIPDSEPMDIGFAVIVDFLNEAGKLWHQVSGHSSTISIAEPVVVLDWQMWSLYAIGLVFFVGCSILIKEAFFPQVNVKKSIIRRVSDPLKKSSSSASSIGPISGSAAGAGAAGAGATESYEFLPKQLLKKQQQGVRNRKQ